MKEVTAKVEAGKEEEDPEKAVATITKLVKENLARYYRTPSSEIQVLTPMQRGVVGASNLNQALQEALNPLSPQAQSAFDASDNGSSGFGSQVFSSSRYGSSSFGSPATPATVPFLRHAGMQFREHDKVMQIRNHYDKEVGGGDIGIISSVDMQERSLTVDFDGRNVSLHDIFSF